MLKCNGQQYSDGSQEARQVTMSCDYVMWLVVWCHDCVMWL